MSQAVKSSNRDALGDETKMLPADPPPWIIRAAAWLIVALSLCALIAVLTVQAPETFRCPCVLAPEGGADPIQAPRLGVVRQVRIVEGQTVAAGEELYSLSSEEVRDWDTQSRTFAEDLKSRASSLEKGDAAYQAQIDIKDQEIAQAEEEIAFRVHFVETTRDLASRLEKLAATGGIAEIEMIKTRLELAGAEKDLSVSRKTLNQARLQRQQLTTEQARRHAEGVSEMEKLRLRLAALSSQMEHASQNLLSITAPYDAVVISIAERTVGRVVQNGQELCQLARPAGRLRARLLVGEAALPRLAVGQPIRFFADAFPYQRYGTITGKLDWISPSAVASADGPHFVALASLDQAAFAVRGENRPLRVGMRGEARVVVGHRTLIEYVLEPVRQLREEMRR